MTSTISRERIAEDLRGLGIAEGDTVLIRGALGQIGRIAGGARTVIDALLDAVGAGGTIVSLAFTETAFIRKPDPNKPFTADTPTYAGALPKAMLAHAGARRSAHPNCSFVAIGANADDIVRGHDADAGAYDPVRTLMTLKAKGVLIGCVSASPGFTTAHLAETDLGLFRRVILPKLNTIYYRGVNGGLKLFKRVDHGLCSQGFSRFYEHYVKEGILSSGHVGSAYSIVVPLAEAYTIEHRLLSADPQFAICDNPDCVMCNVRRWDRIHHTPLWMARRLRRKLKAIRSDA
jgi:aminoglycoside N3'-acetyltransferase